MQRMTSGAVVLLLALAGLLYYAAPSHPTISLAWKLPLVIAEPVAGLERGTGPNLALQAGPFASGSWRKDQASVVPDVAVAPDGTKSADGLVESWGAGLHRIETTISGATPGAVYTLSLFVKPAEVVAIQFEMRDQAPGKYGLAHFNLEGGAVTFEGGDVREGGIQALPDGWYRCWAAMPLAGDTVVLNFTLLGRSGLLSRVGLGSRGLLIWGVQLEPGSGPRGYSAPASRAAR
jgi:hypothetical protein